MKDCPKCGQPMKTCCEAYNDAIKANPALFSVGHSCGQEEYNCKCGHRKYADILEYADMFASLTLFYVDRAFLSEKASLNTK